MLMYCCEETAESVNTETNQFIGEVVRVFVSSFIVYRYPNSSEPIKDGLVFIKTFQPI